MADGSIVVLTGAGVSRESGLSTFRDADGIWQRVRIEDVATPEAFRRDPARVQEFYDARRAQLAEPAVQPNAAHAALAELDRRLAGRVPAGHAERRRPARARRLAAAAAHARRARQGALPRLRRRRTEPAAPGLRPRPVRAAGSAAACVRTWCGSARCRWASSGSRRRSGAAACSSRWAPRAACIRPPASSPRRAATAPARWS